MYTLAYPRVIIRLVHQLKLMLFSVHFYSVEIVKDGEGYPGFVRHRDPGAAAGREPGSSFLPPILHLCRPWCGAVWQIR